MPIGEHAKPRTNGNGRPLKFRDGSVRTEVDVRCYRLSAVQKVAYRLAEKCTVVLGSVDITSLPITFLFPPTTSETAAFDVIRLFFQDLLDQELREQIAERDETSTRSPARSCIFKDDLIRRE